MVAWHVRLSKCLCHYIAIDNEIVFIFYLFKILISLGVVWGSVVARFEFEGFAFFRPKVCCTKLECFIEKNYLKTFSL